MNKEQQTTIQWHQLTEKIIDAPELKSGVDIAESILFDKRLDTLMHKYRQTFDCVVISHIPLSTQGEDITQEDNETRFWVHGSGKYSDDKKPRQTTMEQLIIGFVRMIKYIYAHGKGLFLHPYLFHANQFDNSSPPFCQTIIQRSCQQNRYQEITSGEQEGIKIDSDRGYYHVGTVTIYEERDLREIWDSVLLKATNKEKLRADVEKNMVDAHSLSHDYLCTYLYEGQPIIRASSFFACPTSLLTYPDPTRINKVAAGIGGIFWLTLISNNEAWGDAQREAAEEILKTTWLLVLSEHLRKRHEADLHKGSRSTLAAAAHDMSRIVGAIRAENGPAVLNLIRDYFEKIVKELSIGAEFTRIAQQGERSFVSLMNILNNAAKEAAHLEQLMGLAKRDALMEEEIAEAAFKELEGWIFDHLRLGPLDTLQDITFLLTKSEKNSLSLALTEALRNAIRHTWRAELDTDKKGSITAMCSDSKDLLILENTVVVREESVLIRGKVEGTLGSLRVHARVYNSGNSDSVRLQRQEVTRRDDGFILECWRTDLPLPIERLQLK